MAEALTKKMILNTRIARIKVSSCGLSARLGGEAHPDLKLVLGDDFDFLKNHRTRLLTREIASESDIILVMEDRQVKHVLQRFPETKDKVDTLTHFVGSTGEIKDFGESGHPNVESWLRECQSLLNSSLKLLVERIIAESDLAHRKD
jgi:protein arginine phosphatase